MLEEWKDIPGWEGLYQASTAGRIRSLDHFVMTNVFGKRAGKRLIKGEIVKQFIRFYKGHPELCVNLSKGSFRKQKRVHRLVALTFIKNPDNLPEINHKDENPCNNVVSNLEWCDRKYNMNYGTRLKRQIETFKKNGKNIYRQSKPIVQCFKNGKPFVFWPNTQAPKYSSFNIDPCDICNCVNGKIPSAGGFKWRRPTDDEMKFIEQHKDNMILFYRVLSKK